MLTAQPRLAFFNSLLGIERQMRGSATRSYRHNAAYSESTQEQQRQDFEV
jgi:hypothetical protein